MRYIYGPVKSRRLGLSLGLNLTLPKICSFNCIYCQLGRTPIKTIERKVYIPIEEIFSELKLWLENNKAEAAGLNYISLSGSGEPTLNSRIGDLIVKIKALTNIPVAVITNASLLNMEPLRRQLLTADLLVPSLDAADDRIFQAIDRPVESLHIEEIIEGLVTLRKEFSGKIWLEVMLVRGLNDSLAHIRKLKEAIERIRPDKIQLNSPVRSPAERDLLPPTKNKLQKIKEILGKNCEII